MFARIALRVVFGVLIVVVLLAALSALGWMAYSRGLGPGCRAGRCAGCPADDKSRVGSAGGLWYAGLLSVWCRAAGLPDSAGIHRAGRHCNPDVLLHGFAGGDPEGRGFQRPVRAGGPPACLA